MMLFWVKVPADFSVTYTSGSYVVFFSNPTLCLAKVRVRSLKNVFNELTFYCKVYSTVQQHLF